MGVLDQVLAKMEVLEVEVDGLVRFRVEVERQDRDMLVVITVEQQQI